MGTKILGTIIMPKKIKYIKDLVTKNNWVRKKNLVRSKIWVQNKIGYEIGYEKKWVRKM